MGNEVGPASRLTDRTYRRDGVTPSWMEVLQQLEDQNSREGLPGNGIFANEIRIKQLLRMTRFSLRPWE